MWMFDQLNRIEQKLDRVIRMLARQGDVAMGIKEDIDTLVREVEENSSVADSVQTLLTELSSTLTNLKGQISDPAAQAALQQAVQQLDANNRRIADAVTANTPADR